MKKLLIYLSIIIVIFAVLFIINQQSQRAANESYAEPAERLYQTTPDRLEPATREQLHDENYQNIILRGELDERLQNGESLFVYFFSPLCPYCVESTPILNEIANEVGVEIRQLNVLEDPEAFNHYSFESTPTLIYFEQGEEKSRLVGGIADEGRQELAKQFLTENMQQ